MASDRPAKRTKTTHGSSAPSAAPLAVSTANLDASTSSAPSAKQPQHDSQEHQEPTQEELDDLLRVYEDLAEDYHDIVAELPLEYHRTFTLMRELEDQQQNSTTSLRASLLGYISALSSASSAPSPAASTPLSDLSSTAPLSAPKLSAEALTRLSELEKYALAAVRAGEDKVGLAASLYESVDRHIRRLDASLAASEDALVIGLRAGTLPSHDAPALGEKSPPGSTTSLGAIALGAQPAYELPAVQEEAEEGEKGRKMRKRGGQGQGLKEKEQQEEKEKEKLREGEWKRRREVQKHERKEKKKAEKDKGRGEEAPPTSEDGPVGMPIDPNEPTYCYCQRVSFGEMIACENDDCAREWFHLSCVNLDAAPEGSWYCDDCIAALDIDRKTMQPRR
ncbi:hypothetical protein JCM8097_007752 [Rhodosporidiobolus ruineniae]